MVRTLIPHPQHFLSFGFSVGYTPAPFPKRSHNCGALTSLDVDSRVVLAGWLLPERKVSKSLSFFPLRDSYGTTQLVVHSPARYSPPGPGQACQPTDLVTQLARIPVESIILIQGHVRLRPEKQRRPGPAGDVEVLVSDFTLLNPADRHMPFLPSDTQNMANEDLRSQYRYLDLRRPELSGNIRKRSQVAHIVRTVLNQQDFVEVETPILLKSTPEGAREFLVPTRAALAWGSDPAKVQEPLFFALPQSPQQPKQLLMCSGGVDRYYQLARCFRDEDGRKDRQPEFTQIDLEMAFVSWGNPNLADDPWRIGGHEVRDVVEDLVRTVWAQIEKISLPDRFRVMTYYEAMRRFGSDKPDTRFGLEIVDVTSCLPASTFTALRHSGETVGCLSARQSGDIAFHPIAHQCPTEDGLDRVVITSENMSSWLVDSPTVRGVSPHGDEWARGNPSKMLQLQPGDIVWIGKQRHRPEGGSTALGRQRLRLAELAQSRGTYTPTRTPHFLWMTEFPLFTRADAEKNLFAKGRWSSTHHPFTAPAWQDVQALYDGRISEVRGQHYDLVLNGVEIGGGSVRVHDAMMQEYIFSEVLQLDKHEKASFNHLLHALRCGAPPHGGIALGFDRMVAILCNASSIRDVIAFPKTSAGTDALLKSPAPVHKDMLYQYGIRYR
ncbi:tRNA synthetases class II-domain-containing protein [Multifurca ochricompacta]|uniref:tRNA synthetases class II-domain-containing protein n=1 Tax=Multifurca ochricompacta TaxID=376703 RepID=A0AAD4QMQ9_9AGAM|nr:tRNA synthetases class II-domain-containing protein [Multifurca ochricompacta]